MGHFRPGAPSFCTIGIGSRGVDLCILPSCILCRYVIIYLCQEAVVKATSNWYQLRYSRNNFQKKLKNLLTNSQTYDTICIQGKGNQTESQEKRFKKSKKVLDKPHKVWYNKDTKRTGTSGNKKWVATIADMKGVYYD